MSAVDVSQCRRVYKPVRRGDPPVVALDDVDLEVEEGEIHGLLGPNGAGKTTLVKILSTVLLPTSGRIRVLGRDVVADRDEVRRLTGLVFGGDRGLYTRLTARQNLEYWAALYDVPRSATPQRCGELLERLGLAERARDRVETYSRGMKQRLHLARGLIGDPEVVFLDEPTVGLDPMASLGFRDLVLDLKTRGKTVFLTTHDLDEAEAVCDRVSLIDRGRILATESPATLGRWVSRYEWVAVQGIGAAFEERIAALEGISSIERLPDDWVRFQPSVEGLAARIVRLAVDSGHTSIRTGYPSLEEVYLRLIGDRGMQM